MKGSRRSICGMLVLGVVAALTGAGSAVAASAAAGNAEVEVRPP